MAIVHWDKQALAQVLEICISILTIHQRIFFFVHQSAKRFVIINATNTLFASGMKSIHYIISLQSLQVLLKTLRSNIYDLNAP
jgi:hypothetical protein